MRKKRIFLALCTLNFLPQQQVKADTSDAFIYAAGAACLGIAGGYGIYRLAAWSSYTHAQTRVNQCESAVEESLQRYTTLMDLHELFDRFKSDLDGFTDFSEHLAHDIKHLQEMKSTLQSIKNGWFSTTYATDLVRTADGLIRMIAELLPRLTQYQARVHRIKPIIVVDSMLMHEKKMHFYELLALYNLTSFETKLAAIYAQSQWPFLQAYNDIHARREEYRSYLDQCAGLDGVFSTSVTFAHRLIDVYNLILERISTNPRFTEDQRYKQQYDNEQERLRLERARAEAARRQAEAAERQAHTAHQQAWAAQRQAEVLTQQHIQQLKNRLLEIRLSLNVTKAQINAADPFDYIRCEQLKRAYNLLRSEAISIRNQLYGHPDIIQLFVDIFTTSAYV